MASEEQASGQPAPDSQVLVTWRFEPVLDDLVGGEGMMLVADRERAEQFAHRLRNRPPSLRLAELTFQQEGQDPEPQPLKASGRKRRQET